MICSRLWDIQKEKYLKKNAVCVRGDIMAVKVYTAPGCAFCIIIENFLKKNGIKFKEIDISKDATAKEEMKKKSGQESVPVTEVGGKIIIGYNLKKLKEALNIE